MEIFTTAADLHAWSMAQKRAGFKVGLVPTMGALHEGHLSLIAAAKKTGADYAVDVYPYYGSDVEATLRAGFDIRHGLIGAGVYASHGYERSHIDGVYNTLKVLTGYLDI